MCLNFVRQTWNWIRVERKIKYLQERRGTFKSVRKEAQFVRKVSIDFCSKIKAMRQGESCQNRLLKVCYVSATSAGLIGFFSSFFAAAINSTKEANKAVSMRC